MINTLRGAGINLHKTDLFLSPQRNALLPLLTSFIRKQSTYPLTLLRILAASIMVSRNSLHNQTRLPDFWAKILYLYIMTQFQLPGMTNLLTITLAGGHCPFAQQNWFFRTWTLHKHIASVSVIFPSWSDAGKRTFILQYHHLPRSINFLIKDLCHRSLGSFRTEFFDKFSVCSICLAWFLKLICSLNSLT
jgi:hypothetical protein